MHSFSTARGDSKIGRGGPNRRSTFSLDTRLQAVFCCHHNQAGEYIEWITDRQTDRHCCTRGNGLTPGESCEGPTDDVAYFRRLVVNRCISYEH